MPPTPPPNPGIVSSPNVTPPLPYSLGPTNTPSTPTGADPYTTIGNYFSNAPSISNIARYIVLNAQTSNPIGPGMLGSGPNGGDGAGGYPANNPSLMSRIFDVLSRTNYASANFADDWLKSGSPHVQALWQGLSGQQKTTYSDVLKDAGMPDNTTRGGLGFALDVALDPATYIPVAGAIAKGKEILAGGKAAVAASDAAKAAELAKTLPQRLVDKGEPINPENFGLTSKTTQPPIPDILKGTPPSEVPTSSLGPTPVNPLGPKPGYTTPQMSMFDTLPTKAGAETPLPDKIYVPDNIKASMSPGDLHTRLDESAATPVGSAAIPHINPAETTSVTESTTPVPGQLAFRYPGFSVKGAREQAAGLASMAEDLKAQGAPEILAKLEAGDISQAAKIAPMPPPVYKAPTAVKVDKAAEDIVSNFAPNKSTAIINQKFPDTLNAKQQVKLWYQSQDAARSQVWFKNRSKAKVSQEINDRARAIYTSAENKLIDAGKVPRIGTGEDVKLSDVAAQLAQRGIPVNDAHLKEFGTAIKPGSDVWRAVETLRARGAINDSGFVKEFMDRFNATRNSVQASAPLSDGAVKNVDDVIKSAAAKALKLTKLSPASQEATKNLMDLTINLGKTSAQITIEHMAPQIEEVIAKGKASAIVNGAITRALEKDLGKLPSWAINDNKVVEFTMGRVATSFGQKDLRPISLNAISSAQATAATRGMVLDNMFSKLPAFADPNLRKEALLSAQGLSKAATPEAQQLSDMIKSVMNNLVGPVRGNSVLMRSGLNMAQLNKWMERYKVGFNFTNGVVKDITGAERDFSKGIDWINSWKAADIKTDPKAFMFRFQQAMEQAVREKSMYDEIGERFGSKLPGNGYQYKITGHPYLEPYYFPKDISEQIPRVVRDWSIPAWHPNSPLLQHYDRIVSMWKAGVTFYRPGRYIRDFLGDIYLGWMDGVNSARPYTLAMRVQRSMHGAYQNLADVDKLIQMGTMPARYGTPKPGEVLFRNKSGIGFSAEQIAAVAHQKGLIEPAQSIHDIIDMGDSEYKQKGILDIKPFGGKVQATAKNVSEAIEHNVRLAHFIDKVMKSRGNDLASIFESASQRTRKWHPTGLDLTEFEKKAMRRILPFYTFVRKEIPLVLEGLVMHPGKVVVPAKAMQAVQVAQGQNYQSRDNPFPVDQMFPQWIRDEGLGALSTSGPLGGLLGGMSNQIIPGYTALGIGSNPLTELVGDIYQPKEMLGADLLKSNLTPALKIPMELITGTNFSNDQPILGLDAKPGALQQYIGQQIPLYSAFQNITGNMLGGGVTTQQMRGGSEASKESLIDYMLGIGIRGTGPYIQQARDERQQPIDARNQFLKSQFMYNLRNQMGNG